MHRAEGRCTVWERDSRCALCVALLHVPFDHWMPSGRSWPSSPASEAESGPVSVPEIVQSALDAVSVDDIVEKIEDIKDITFHTTREDENWLASSHLPHTHNLNIPGEERTFITTGRVTFTYLALLVQSSRSI